MTVSILGYGWLGKALFKELKKQDVDLHAFSRSLDSSSDQLHRFDLSKDSLPEFGNTLICTLPPKDLQKTPRGFRNLTNSLSKSTHLIYISSTSVFDDSQGLCNEGSTPLPQTERGKLQLKLEFLAQKNTKGPVTIVRAGGLIGEDRFPSFSADHRFPEGQVVNLIHQMDLIQIISRTLTLKKKPQIIHAVAPFHPTKKDYYQNPNDAHLRSLKKFKGKKITSLYLDQTAYTFLNPKLKIGSR